jgi:hypothetical protein
MSLVENAAYGDDKNFIIKIRYPFIFEVLFAQLTSTKFDTIILLFYESKVG